MYLKHWGLLRRPFENSHAPELFVPVESAMLALTKLRYAAAMGLGCACVYGDCGAGKSELLRMVLHDFANSGWAALYLANPAGPRDEMFRLLLRHLDGSEYNKPSPYAALEARLTEIAAGGGRVLLAIDDAHCVQDLALLNDLRMLLNIEHEGSPVLNILVGGQENVLARLAEAGRFDARVALKIRVLPFNEEEAEAYMLARLKSAGCTRGIFTRQAAELVFQASGGLPGNINRICELALVTAYAAGDQTVRPEVIRAAAAELGLRNDAGTQRMLDEIWSEELPPQEVNPTADVDVLADLTRDGI